MDSRPEPAAEGRSPPPEVILKKVANDRHLGKRPGCVRIRDIYVVRKTRIWWAALYRIMCWLAGAGFMLYGVCVCVSMLHAQGLAASRWYAWIHLHCGGEMLLVLSLMKIDNRQNFSARMFSEMESIGGDMWMPNRARQQSSNGMVVVFVPFQYATPMSTDLSSIAGAVLCK